MTVTIPPPPGADTPRSPFTPTFGVNPPALVGRQREVDDFAYAIDSGPGAKGRATLVTGQRGVGKSVMLNVFHQIAATRQWMGIHAHASPGFAQTLATARLPEVLEQLPAVETTRSETVGATLSILGFGGGITQATTSTSALIPDFRHQLMRLLEALHRHGTGLLLTVDEVHRSQLGELQEVTDAVSYAFAQGAPVAFAAAGPPDTVNTLVNADVSTYLRRAERVTLGDLRPEDTRTAFEAPILEAGREISPDALDLAVAQSGNYPYLVQLMGDEAWRAAGADDIEEEHVRIAGKRAENSMFRQIHEPMISVLSPRERQYIEAMIHDRGTSRTAALADRIDVSVSQGGTYRNRLISSGILESAGRGAVRFAVPYTREYLQTERQRETEG